MSKSQTSNDGAVTALFSACLLGKNCRYDGRARAHAASERIWNDLEVRGVRCVAVCPEELGGLGTPRPAAHLISGGGHSVLDGLARVVTVERKKDITAQFISGAEHALEIGSPNISLAVLKARSPSCGIDETRINGILQKGDGVFAAMLRRKGVPVFSEESTELSIEQARELTET